MADFIPFSIDVVDGRSLARWIDRSDARSTPFIAEMIRAPRAQGHQVRGVDVKRPDFAATDADEGLARLIEEQVRQRLAAVSLGG